jgi:hypothetical protein
LTLQAGIIKFKEEVVPMPQISLYIDEKTLKKLENVASSQQVSISKWVADQIRTRLQPVYPANFGTLFGSISDSSFNHPSDLSFSTDTKREKL